MKYAWVYVQGKVCQCEGGADHYVLMGVASTKQGVPDGKKRQISVCTKCQGEVKGSLPELDAFFQ